MIIDLHTHSTHSDGVLKPKEIIDTAVNNNVSILAISDHDTIEAYNDELFKYAKEMNIKLIPAVEISTKYNNKSVHVLGYNFDLNNTELKEKLKSLRNTRHDYLYKVSEKLNELGYFLNTDELNKIESVTKAHISLDIINNNKNNELLTKVFGHIPTKGEFIETIMNEGCPGYVKKESMTPNEASKLIKQANGKVFLAHPVAYKYEDGLTEQDIANIVDSMELDGIETNYIYVNKNNEVINECDIWNQFAVKHNLKTSIGSDFHNYDNIHPTIGFTNYNITFDYTNLISFEK